MHIVHEAHTAPLRRRPQSQPLAWVQVERGTTRFPRRPVESSRFLIGSGTNCHLQLGGDFPLLHSLLVRESGGWRIEAIAPAPPLQINGADIRTARLQADDVVQIGPFAFRLLTADFDAADRRSRRSLAETA